MLYSIGYQRLSVESLIERLKENQVQVLLDVRSKPYSRKPGFSKNQLATKLRSAGIGYRWHGDALGGFTDIKETDIEFLAFSQKTESACLMCMEADPDQCHRKYEIARRLEKYGVEVFHL